MEYIEGIELINFINSFPHDEAMLRYVFKKLLKALLQLHKAGVAHRDVKLENVMITLDDVKLVDFGFGVQLNSRNSGFFKTIIGTGSYVLPEPYHG